MTLLLPSTLVESYYGSAVTLATAEDGSCTGTYEAELQAYEPARALRGDLGATPARATSMLMGRTRKLSDDSGTEISGTWQYANMPDSLKDVTRGTFQMLWNGRSGEGWWATVDGQKVPWLWNEPRGMVKPHSRESANLLMIGIARYSILAAWAFFIMTACQLLMGVLGANVWHSRMNLLFNCVYTIGYLLFLVAYCVPQARPSKMYISGVVLYTLGYASCAAFLAVDLVTWPEPTAQSGVVVLATRTLYRACAAFFLVGSVALMLSTYPALRQHPCGVAPSLFWGSFLFFVGSAAFTYDAFPGGPVLVSHSLVVGGYGAFLPGRMFFLIGSSSQLCDIWLRNPSRMVHRAPEGMSTSHPKEQGPTAASPSPPADAGSACVTV